MNIPEEIESTFKKHVDSLSKSEVKVFTDYLVGLLGCERRIVNRWVKGEYFTKGPRLILVGQVLSENGHDVFVGLPNEVRECIANVKEGKISFEKLEEKLGIGRAQLMAILLGKHDCSNENRKKLHRINAMLSEGKSVEKLISRTGVKTQEKQTSELFTPDHLIEVLAFDVAATAPMLDKLLSGDKEFREKLRNRLGPGGIFRHANRWNKLCSEEANKPDNQE